MSVRPVPPPRDRGGMPPLPESAIDAHLERERQRLLNEAGLAASPLRHFRKLAERPFLEEERDSVTILTGGFSRHHDLFLRAGFQGLGYTRTELVPTPTKADYQTGKEYGNNGQCSPTYFTVGALVNYLKRLRDEEGLSTETIVRDYVFVTMGACGPCRFGMYESEYRLALRNAGFEGFRIVLFQIKGGVHQVNGQRPGIAFNFDFFLTFGNLVMLADLVNEVSRQIRPYEVVPGRTDLVFEKVQKKIQAGLRELSHHIERPSAPARLLAPLLPLESSSEVDKFLAQLRSRHFVSILEECARMIDDEIEVDYTRLRPKVKVTGEFWATLTEGDGNYKMYSYLESQGAEVAAEPITTWITFLVSQARIYAKDAKGLASAEAEGGFARFRARAGEELQHHKRMLVLGLTERILNREYDRLRAALGGTANQTVDHDELRRLAHSFYNSRSQGGEGHMEVAKNIYYSSRGLAHMVLSLKPFGCLPSTQSDGAQVAVLAQYPQATFLPVETSGEGDINAYSRVQMVLAEAKTKSRDEFQESIAKTGFSLEQIRAYVATRRELRRPLQQVPKVEGIAGRAASFVQYVACLMREDGLRPDPASCPS